MLETKKSKIKKHEALTLCILVFTIFLLTSYSILKSKLPVSIDYNTSDSLALRLVLSLTIFGLGLLFCKNIYLLSKNEKTKLRCRN